MNSQLASRLAAIPHRVMRPPLHEASFWVVQAMVVGLAAAHLAVDLKWARPGALPAGIPVTLLLVPVGYAALRYGLSGSVATATWAVLLWIPDLFLPHGHGHIGNDLIELALVAAVAVFVGYYIDVERLERAQVQRAESEHRAAEAKYRQLFDTNAAPILLLDHAGTILEANPAAQALGHEDVAGKPLAEIAGCGLGALLDGGSRLITIDRPPAGPRDYRVSLTNMQTAPAREPFIQLVLEDVTEERAEGQRVRRFAELLLNVQEEERRRIARQLHDEPLQLLVQLARALEHLAAVPGIPAALANGLADTRHQTLEVADHLRAVAGDLRPPALEQLGLVATVRGFLAGAEESAATRMELHVTGSGTRLTPEIELGAFRIVQEAVNNVIRHADADNLWLTLAFEDNGLCLRVADDGKGFDPAVLERRPQAERLGLLGMRERAALLGGRLNVQSAPGEGTIIEAKLSAALSNAHVRAG